ncbi:MAG: hypothetical protein AAF629_24385 [Chloroflexota bacterium]
MKRVTSKWPKVGPLGRDAGQVFSTFVYEDNNSPLTLTMVCTGQAIMIFSNTEHVDASEIDITVADQALFLKLSSDDIEADSQSSGHPDILINDNEENGVYKIPLMFEIDVTQIEAGYDNDLLHIKLPRLDSNQGLGTLNYLQ